MKLPISLFAVSLMLTVAGAFAACDGGESENACEPGAEVFCKCRGGFDGTKTCLDDGESFGPCLTPDGECPEIGNTTSTGSGMICDPGTEKNCECPGGGSGSQFCGEDGLSYGACSANGVECASGAKKLFEPCTASGECATGVCVGYCTFTCGSYEDCQTQAIIDETDINADCTRVPSGAGQEQVCTPYCANQADCGTYGFGPEVTCGGAAALDDPSLSYAACSDWGEAATGLPYGTLCDFEAGEVLYLGEALVEATCDLGLAGVQNECVFGECTQACYENIACPAMDCTSNGNVPGCCASDASCQ